MTQPQPFDTSSIRRIRDLGGPELLGRVIELFLDGARKRFARLDRAADSGDLYTIADSARLIRNGATLLGLGELQAALQDILALAEKGRLDRVRAHLPALEKELHQAAHLLRSTL